MATGRRFRIRFRLANPCDIPFRVANVGAASPSVQVLLNKTIIGEYAALTAGTLPCAIDNLLELIVADGGVDFSSKILGSLATFESLYPQGSDPFNASSSPSGSGPSAVGPSGTGTS